MKFILFLTPLLFILYFSMNGCVSHNEEDLYGNDCDTLNMTYSTVKYIFENNCYQCHTVAQGYLNIKLDTYSDVKAAVRTNKLIGAINHLNGYQPMPRPVGQPKLSDCEIKKIEAWVNADMP
jgi:hypothetical protein